MLPARNVAADLTNWLDEAALFADAVVALDDGSTDDTGEVLQAHPLVTQVLTNPPRPGYLGWHDGANRNRLLAAAAELSPAWIFFLDADERLDPSDAEALRAFVRGDVLRSCAYGLRVYRMLEDERYDPAYQVAYRLFAFHPGQRLPVRRFGFAPIPRDLPGAVATTLRIKHYGEIGEDGRRARLAKLREADPDGVFRVWYSSFPPLSPGPHPRWAARAPETPVVAAPDDDDAADAADLADLADLADADLTALQREVAAELDASLSQHRTPSQPARAFLTSEELVERIAPEQRLLLHATVGERAGAMRAWDQWRAAVDFDEVDELSKGLLALLARRMDELAPDERLRGLIRGLYKFCWTRNRVLWSNVKPVLAAFQSAGVPVILLKGLALLPAYDHDWGARPMGDVDLLVPDDRIDDALTILRDLEWLPEDGATYDWVRWRAVPHRHSWGFSSGDGQVDLHWRALLGAIGPHADDDFWSATRPTEIDGVQVLTLDPADQLLHVLLHGTDPLTSIQWVADAVLTARWAGPAKIADRLATQAQARGRVEAVRSALEAIGRIVGTETVGPLVDRMRDTRPRVLERAEARLAGRAGGRLLSELSRHADARTGFVPGAAALVSDRLDLGQTSAPRAAVAYAAAGRSVVVGRFLRRVGGMSARTAVPGAPLDDGDEVPLSQPAFVDQYCGPGWSRIWHQGVLTYGAEARLVLPLAPSLERDDVVVTLDVRSVGGHRRFEVVANESLVCHAVAGLDYGRVACVISASVARRFKPLELALRCSASQRLRGRGELGLQVASLRVERANSSLPTERRFL